METETMARSRAETIAYIRCLLLSKEGEMYVLPEFLSDFEDQAGYALPRFQCNTVEDFLRSIPDVVQVIVIEGKFYLRLVEVPCDSGDNPTPSLKVKAFGKINHESKSAPESEAPEDDLSGPETEKRNQKRNGERKRRPRYTYQKGKRRRVYNPDGFCDRCRRKPPSVKAKIDMYLSCIVFDESDIPCIDLDDHADIGGLIEVSVPEVSTPHRFILHLKKYQLELSEFMGKMMTFYTIYSEKYALERYTFEENEVCVAFYGIGPEGREWYRARVVNVGTDASTVFLIDYGLTVKVSHWNLRYLDRFFGDFPAQAINGCLANIKPCPGENWSQDCCERFYDLVMDKDLLAHVANMNLQKRWLSVVLSYPNSGVKISDALIEESTVADCEICEDESFSSLVHELENPQEFIQRGDKSKLRRLKFELARPRFAKIVEDVAPHENNKLLRRMLGYMVSDNE